MPPTTLNSEEPLIGRSPALCVQCGAPLLCFYRLDVEAELHHVAVLHDVVLALH